MKEDAKGISIHTAWFIHAVNNGLDVPETSFAISSHNSGRRVMMFLTALGLVCKHEGKTFIVPTSNIKFMNVNEEA
jgi:hypothetical protein